MINASRPRSILLPFFLLIALSGYSRAEETVVIVHPDNPVTSLTNQQLKAIFTSKQTLWPSGEHIAIFVLPPSSPLQQQFCKKHMSMYCYQLERIWQRLLYSGFGSAPMQVTSEDNLINKVAANPAAIGFARKDYVDTQVKTVSIH